MTINHAIKIKMPFAFIRTKIKPYTLKTEQRGRGKEQEKDDD